MNKLIYTLQKLFILKKPVNTIKKNKLSILTILKKSAIRIDGIDNNIEIKQGNLKKIKIGITGNDNSIKILSGAFLRNLEIIIEGNGHNVFIGENAEIGGASIVCCGQSTNVTIGNDCLLASNISIKSCDGHAIYKNNEVINASKDITIDNHVWIAQDVSILKGVSIGRNSVVGINSLVTSNKFEPNVIIGGVPVKVINSNITWGKERV